ncbi:SOS response-associated peptidase [Halorarius litoreus]|uniref:SOS response-associated peptidase n=1 Tax=Halorarius litoreus TaxID=2962676 RepID=UPI0020CECDA4|nr:SOS response-associated peptidase [Halorarius litoreus]
MCGRYSIFLDPREVAERFDVAVPDDLEPHYNAAPTQSLPVVTNHAPDRVSHQQWGLIPRWADDDFQGLINARGETVTEKPAFRDAYQRRRCLVLADGYYEWQQREGGKQPYRITLPDGEPFAMAGLWERWTPPTKQTGLSDFGDDASDDEETAIETFTVITTDANEFQSQYHHRMPVVLSPDEERAWLGDPSPDMLDPYDGEMRAYPVSTKVNSPVNDSPEVVEEIEA